MSMTWQDVQRMNNIAFLQSQIACAQIEAMGMAAQNLAWERLNSPKRFEQKDFDALINKYGIGHNAALDTLRMNL